MINFKKGPSSLHIGFNGSSDTLLDQCHCQGKGNKPAACVCNSAQYPAPPLPRKCLGQNGQF